MAMAAPPTAQTLPAIEAAPLELGVAEAVAEEPAPEAVIWLRAAPVGADRGVELVTMRVEEEAARVEDLGELAGVAVEVGVKVEVEVGVCVWVVWVGVGVGVEEVLIVTSIQLRSLEARVWVTETVPSCAAQEAEVVPATLQEREAVLPS